MSTHNQHPPQVHNRQPLKDRQSRGELLVPPEPLSTVKRYPFPAVASDSPDEEADAADCNLPQPEKNDFSQREPADAAECNLPQPRENEFADAQAADATRCNLPQPRKNELAGPSTDLSGVFSGDAEQILSVRQRSAIELLLTGEEDGRVAEKVGVNRTTLWRWKQNPYFRTALDEAREMVFGAAIDRLRGLAPRAINILQAQLETGDGSAAIRLLRLIRVDRPQR